MVNEINYKKEQQLANYLNKYVVPQDLKLRNIILKSQTNKKGECKVYVELRRYSTILPEHNKRKRIPTEIWVMPKHWSVKKEEVLKSDFKYQDKNRVINDLHSRISNYINNPNIDYKFAQLSREEFLMIEEVFPTKRLLEYKKSLVNYIEKYIEYRKKNTVRNTAKEFTTMQNRIKNFDLHRDKKTYLNDINFTWSEEFDDYMRNKAKYKYTEGTIEKTFTILITVLNYYYKKRDELQLEMNDKFREKGFKKGRKSVNKANPLTEEQLQALKSYKFKEKQLRLIRDRFIWQCYTGIRFIDAFKITKNEIQDGWLRFIPSKTERHNVQVEQPLHEVAISLLEKYEYDMTRLKITNQAYNRGLREMFTKLNNDKKLKLNGQNQRKEDSKNKYDINFGSYASRDTFISRAVQAGIDWKTILEWVGQSSYTIMNRFIKTEDKFKKEQMKKIQ